MSFLKRLFGGGGGNLGIGAPAALGREEYKGFTITALEMRAGPEFQLAGTIAKEIGGEVRMHKFVRADRIGSRDELVSVALAKGRQIIDERGEDVFGQTWPPQS